MCNEIYYEEMKRQTNKNLYDAMRDAVSKTVPTEKDIFDKHFGDNKNEKNNEIN